MSKKSVCVVYATRRECITNLKPRSYTLPTSTRVQFLLDFEPMYITGRNTGGEELGNDNYNLQSCSI